MKMKVQCPGELVVSRCRETGVQASGLTVRRAAAAAAAAPGIAPVWVEVVLVRWMHTTAVTSWGFCDHHVGVVGSK